MNLQLQPRAHYMHQRAYPSCAFSGSNSFEQFKRARRTSFYGSPDSASLRIQLAHLLRKWLHSEHQTD